MSRRFAPAPEQAPTAAQQLEAVFEHAPTGVALVAADGRFLRANPALARMLGRSVPEVLKLRCDKSCGLENSWRDHNHSAADFLPVDLRAMQIDRRRVARAP